MKLVRRGEVSIKADNAEEAAAMATRLGSAFLDNLELHVEVALDEANRVGKNGKSLKYAIAKRNKKMRKYLADDYDIPF